MYCTVHTQKIQKKELGCILIIVPAAVVNQWVEEFHYWYSPARVEICHGNKKEKALKKAKRKECDVIISTYDTLRIFKESFDSVKWEAAIFDEAHQLKNYKGKKQECVKSLNIHPK